MYPDPKRVRDVRRTIRLDDYEDALIEAIANYRGEQYSTVFREMAMASARELFGDDLNVMLQAA